MRFRFAASILLLAICSSLGTTPADAATLFNFKSTTNGISFTSSGQIAVDDFVMSLSAGPASAGAEFREFSSGLGIQTRATSKSRDSELDKFDLVRDVDSNDIVAAESMTFSFDKPGVLVELDFDGVKDEAYEYFVLQTSSSPDLYFFDSFEDTMGGDPGLIDVPGQVVFLQEGSNATDDKSPALAIPFVAGQQFTLTYGQLDGIQDGQLVGNGARLQGITIVTVPEPSALAIAVGLAAAVASWRRSR